MAATTVMAALAARQEDDSDTEGNGENTGNGEFDAFASDLETALQDVDATLVSSCECPRFAEVVVTTQGTGTDDETFHEELAIVAGEYARLADRTEELPAFGVLVYVYETPGAATESITDPFARYTIRTEWAEDALETEDSEEYLSQILLTVDPPVDGAGDEDTADGGPADAGDADVEITDHELVHDDSGFTTETYVAATVENVGDGATGEITLDARWYSEGDYLDADSASLQTLGADETWRARVEYLGTGGEEVDEYELTHEVESDPPTASEGLELVDDEMRVGEDEVVVEGRVENDTGEEQSYVEAIAKFYDDENTVLADEWTNVLDVPEGETWAFEITWFSFDRTDDVADYDVVLSNRL